MNYEEKRELRLQISQLLADAGLNQQKIKEMVEEEIKNKVEKAIDQKLISLNAQCRTGNYISERVDKIFDSPTMNYHISTIVKDELKNRVIQIVLKDCSQAEGIKDDD